MELTSVQLQQLKKIELNIFREFIRVCETLNLKYFLLGGTLLGAVRHQGFIPWDDDIDVGMLRKDYEIFISKGQPLLPKGLFIQTIDTDPNYPANFAKIRNSNTTYIESSVASFKMNHGVFIDIFPLDFYPNSTCRQKQLDWKLKLYGRRIVCDFNIEQKSNAKNRVLSKLLKLRYPSLKAALIRRERLYKSVQYGDKIANFGGAWGKKEIVPKDWYGEGVSLLFEGITVNVPEKYDKWLSQVYGNYMELPPKEKRVGHHYTDAVDFEKSYLEYVTEVNR